MAHTIEIFKGTMMVTSKFPVAKDSWTVYRLLKSYLDFMSTIMDYPHFLLIIVHEEY